MRIAILSGSTQTLYRVALPVMFGAFLVACSGSDGKNGTNGTNGAPALVKTTPEAAGANCAGGGTKVEFGLDKNGNGQLDADEIGGTSYICNGSGSNGQTTLVKTSQEPGGTNCQWGGIKIETGKDANNDGVLDPNEVDSKGTTYVCNLAPSGTITRTEGMVANIKQGGVSTGSPITVRFTLKDKYGYPVDINGVYSINALIQPRFALGYYTKDANGNVTPLKVYTQTTSLQSDGGASLPQPSAYNPKGTAPGQGKLTENGQGAGDYTYEFPATDTAPTSGVSGALGVKYDANKLTENHVVWVQVSRQTDLQYQTNANTYYTANFPYYFTPNNGNAGVAREVIKNANCQKCHDNFRLETTTTVGLHGGGRIDGTFCTVCHNPDRWSNPEAEAKTFVHRIHAADEFNLATAQKFHGIAATYPQAVNKCDVCHGGASAGAQAQNNPSRGACAGCHAYTSFTGQGSSNCTNPPAVDGNGNPVTCKHVGGTQADDTKCTQCHKAADIDSYHVPVIPPDPANSRLDGGTNSNTNAGYMAAGGYQVPDAGAITYNISSVSTWTDGNIKRPQIVFKIQENGKDVVFNSLDGGAVPTGGIEPMAPNYVGSPSVYFAWAVPQDGIAKPADFNASASAYIKAVINGTGMGTSTGQGTITGPDANGFYTIKLTNAQIAPEATMLTGGVGYTYSISGCSNGNLANGNAAWPCDGLLGRSTSMATQPLTQTNLAAYPYVAGPDSTGATRQGGLELNPQAVWKTATGFTGRRPIVDNNKCKDCHGMLGVAPTFHAGQRNDGPTCSFCHTQNRTSSGWSAGSRTFIHAIHAARKRQVPFMWHAVSATGGYGDVEFPAALNDCQMCHLPNTYDFTAPASLSAFPNISLQADATGTYDPNSPTKFTFSPYVVVDNVTSYGTGFSYNAATNAYTYAGANNLVSTPLAAVCTACHDSQIAVAHIKANGGGFYDPRTSFVTNAGTANAQQQSKEQCMICHGPGRAAAIGEVHLKR